METTAFDLQTDPTSSALSFHKLDERSKRVYATRAGRDLVSGLETAMAEVAETVLRPLSFGDRKTLLSLLSNIAARYPVELV